MEFSLDVRNQQHRVSVVGGEDWVNLRVKLIFPPQFIDQMRLLIEYCPESP